MKAALNRGSGLPFLVVGGDGGDGSGGGPVEDEEDVTAAYEGLRALLDFSGFAAGRGGGGGGGGRVLKALMASNWLVMEA